MCERNGLGWLGVIASIAATACSGSMSSNGVSEGDAGGGSDRAVDSSSLAVDSSGASDGTAPDRTAASDGGSSDTGPSGDAGRLEFDAGPHGANPVLANLPPNTALDLGRYRCEDRLSQIANRCGTITDYSRLNYDPYLHRVLLFGGGHAATGRTDVDVLDLGTLTWNSLYDSMSCEEVAANDIDPRGFHRATGHPVARHTYDQNVIVDVDGTGYFMMFSTEGFAGTCHQYNAPIRSVARLPLAPGETAWSYSPEMVLPWAYAATAEFDPPSGMVILLGSRRGAGEGGMWVFDPAGEMVVTFVDSVRYSGIDNNLVYFPPNQKMYFIQRGPTQTVWELTLDRDEWSSSENVTLSPMGPSPQGTTGFAYDTRRQVIGGGVEDSRFFTFDPIANEWTSEEMNIMSEEGASVGALLAHHIDYDTVDDVYIFIAAGDQGRRTWAYRP